MKRIINIIALSVFIFFSCKNKNAEIKLKFNPISKLDFTLYNYKSNVPLRKTLLSSRLFPLTNITI